MCTESSRQSGGKILIHCRAGISRSATICIAYLMYAGRLTLDEAHDYLKRRRPLISPNLNFMRQLAEFGSSLATGAGGLRRPSDSLVSSIVARCATQRTTTPVADSFPPVCQIDVGLPKSWPGIQMESGGGGLSKKRKALSDLLLPCGSAAAKVTRIGGLQPPPPTPCMKQAFVFDLATVAVLMSGHATAGSPTMSQSPLVSPS